MKGFDIKKNIFLILGLITLLVGAIYFFSFEQNNAGNLNANYQKHLQKNIIEVIDEATLDQDKILSQVKAKKLSSFEQSRVSTYFPYYIFKNKKIAYWSDHRYVPDYEKIDKSQEVSFEEHNQNLGLIKSSSFFLGRDTIEVFSTINLYKYYQNQNDYLQSGYNEEIFNLFL